MNDDQALIERAEQLEKAAKDRFGEAGWGQRLNALAAAGVTGDAARVLVQSGDLNQIDFVSKEALLRQAQDGSREAADAYSDIRSEERKAYRDRKGRGR